MIIYNRKHSNRSINSTSYLPMQYTISWLLYCSIRVTHTCLCPGLRFSPRSSQSLVYDSLTLFLSFAVTFLLFHFLQYLDENKQLILAILDNQNTGKVEECARWVISLILVDLTPKLATLKLIDKFLYCFFNCIWMLHGLLSVVIFMHLIYS